MFELKTIVLFFLTAIAEIVGCYLPYLWLKQDKSILVLIPAFFSLALFAWLLSLHPFRVNARLRENVMSAG